MNNIVLYQPEIPQNTGNIMRTCVATNTKLHLIKPLGFSLDEKHLIRSGVNYIDKLEYTIYEDFNEFKEKNPGTYYYFTRYGHKPHTSFDYSNQQNENIYFIFGKESTGIPKEILNKPGKLNEQERQIMDLHADLGYELLSGTSINKRVLNLIKNHHMPVETNNDVLGQILSVADIYSALREQRSYKAPLSDKETLQILDQKAKNGEVSTEVVNTLKSIIKVPVAA